MEDCIEAYSISHSVEEFDYLNVKYLLDYIDVGNDLSFNQRNILIQESETELPNDLDLICQLLRLL